MKKGWTKAPLGEVLNLDIDAVAVDPTESYPFAGVFGFGRGLFIRESVSGSDTTYKYFHRLHKGQLVMSQPKGWEGAITVVPKEFEGRFLSSVFPTFRSNEAKLTSEFLCIITKCKWLWDALFDKSIGIGARRNSIYPAQLLEVEIPLPPIVEQQRIVAHMDAIEERLNRVRKLREEAHKEHLIFVTSLAHRWDLSREKKFARGWCECALSDVLRLYTDTVVVEPTESYPNLGIYGFAKGTFSKSPIEGANSSATKLFRVRGGQFIYSRLFAFEGAYAIVDESQDGFFVSNEFPSFDLDKNRVLPEFLSAYFKSPAIWDQLTGQATGLGDRRRRIHPEVILAHQIKLPPMKYQEKVRVAFNKLATIEIQSKARAFDALLPSILDVVLNG